MEVLTILLLLVIAAQTTYLTVKRTERRGRKRRVFVDTSVLIDGRIVAICSSGFMSDTLVIPRSVVRELQLLADSADSEKRSRARYGLDVVAELQAMETIQVEILQDKFAIKEGVDERLLALAKQYHGVVCTIDYNLNKVAQVEQIPVLNVNELAKELRTEYLPGEHLTMAVTTKGNDATQGVGHLPDGTMVVVEKAKSKIGQIVAIEVIRSLQTAAGKMVFARLIGGDKETGVTKTVSKTKDDASATRSNADKDSRSNDAKKRQGNAPRRDRMQKGAEQPDIAQSHSRNQKDVSSSRRSTSVAHQKMVSTVKMTDDGAKTPDTASRSSRRIDSPATKKTPRVHEKSAGHGGRPRRKPASSRDSESRFVALANEATKNES